MIGNITSSLKKLFGDKSTRDMKAIQPLVDKTNEVFHTLASLTNDEIRERTTGLKKTIEDRLSADRVRVEELKAKAESDSKADAAPVVETAEAAETVAPAGVTATDDGGAGA